MEITEAQYEQIADCLPLQRGNVLLNNLGLLWMGVAVVYWYALESLEFFKTLGKSTSEHKKCSEVFGC